MSTIRKSDHCILPGVSPGLQGISYVCRTPSAVSDSDEQVMIRDGYFSSELRYYANLYCVERRRGIEAGLTEESPRLVMAALATFRASLLTRVELLPVLVLAMTHYRRSQSTWRVFAGYQNSF
jgi:hypothetical protein